MFLYSPMVNTGVRQRFIGANTLTEVIPQILAQGLMALRSNCVMPSLVNSDYGMDAKKKGNNIDVPIPSAVAVRDVAPGAVPVQAGDSVPTSANIPLDQWKEAPFYLTDKDVTEAVAGVIPMQASEAVKALSNTVNAYIFALYKDIYGFSAGSTNLDVTHADPFASTTAEATAARKVLNEQLAPIDDMRSFVMDPGAESNALDLRAFNDVNFVASAEDVREGRMTRKLGFRWSMDQQVPTHTPTGALTGATVNGVNAAGSTTLSIAKATATFDLLKGDVISIAGFTQTYVVTADTTLIVGNTSVPISPALQAATAGGEVIDLNTAHTVNLAFHRDCFAFASRPLQDLAANELGSIVQAATDPVSGLTLRLEVTRQHKQINWSYDMLYGAATVRPEFGVRIPGLA